LSDSDAGLPFLMSVVNGDGGIEISLFEVIVLKGSDGPGAAVGIEIVGVVTDHAADIGENVGRENVLVGGDAHGLEVVCGLELRDCAGGSCPWGNC